MAGSAIKHINELATYNRLINGITPCIVKFTAAWCGPCKRIAPHVEKLASEHYGVLIFLEIDVDDESAGSIVKHEGVSAMPTFIFYVEGKKVASFAGAHQGNLDKEVKALLLTASKSEKKPEKKIEDVPAVLPKEEVKDTVKVPDKKIVNLEDDDVEDSSSSSYGSSSEEEGEEMTAGARAAAISTPKLAVNQKVAVNVVNTASNKKKLEDASEMSAESDESDPFSASGDSSGDEYGEDLETPPVLITEPAKPVKQQRK